ncbi:hypothetical protein B0T17DRAFT_486908 [Bombardia bombarda]|uniref:PAS domain-containing protein n=1 Tax=Bombardia bombarda TaxID=252184 RepID=A0AA39XCD1_9PEZI|nr:hypothetical protein B0T17DRAFT_486908 [Bombardia bombarda]
MDPRDQTFMTIHNLTPDANILFASDSIFDILGYQPDEVQGKSCFNFFHLEEVPFARSIHRRGVLLDKAAVLHYARILSKNGQWVSCECCFTVVHDVLVACTSIYLRGKKSERRALEAPHIRRIFSSSPRDPRYHMLEHLSPKFKMPPMEHEPRAALILNRFTRNLSIMFATNAVSAILGLEPDEIKDKAFYELIQENCLQNAIQCLESAKANESIAYLRFFFRDPRISDGDQENDIDEEHADSGSGSDSEDGELVGSQMDIDEPSSETKDEADCSSEDGAGSSISGGSLSASVSGRVLSLQTTGTSTYQTPLTPRSPATGDDVAVESAPCRRREYLELEAVVSCTSDGLVVVLRRARPPIPNPQLPLTPAFNFENGLCAAPWALRPIQPYTPPEHLYVFRPPLLPQHMPLRENVKAAGGPPIDQLMRSIREVGVFAWALVGINGNLAGYGQGVPSGGAQPQDGIPIWDPNAGPTEYQGPENSVVDRRTETDKTARRESAGLPAQIHTSYPATRERSPSYDQAQTTQSTGDYTFDNRQRTPLATWSSAVGRYSSGGYVPGQSQQQLTLAHGAARSEGQHHHRSHTSSSHTRSPVSAPYAPPPEPWTEGPRPRAYSPNYAIPSPRAPGSSELPYGSRYVWP